MKKQFVTYEIALKLKELGFDEPCFGYYTPMKEWMMEGTRINPERHFHGCNWANSDNSMYFMYKQNSFGDRDSIVKNSEFTKAIHNVAAPLWQQIIDWFRIKHKLHITITSQSQESWQYHIQFPHDSLDKLWEEDFNSYEEAREAAILKVIEIVKQLKK